jgi:hypothetical protein
MDKIKDEVDRLEDKYVKNCLDFLVIKVRSGSGIRIRYNYLGSPRIRPDQKVINDPTGSTTLFKQHFKGL